MPIEFEVTVVYMVRAADVTGVTVLKFCGVIDVPEMCNSLWNKSIKYERCWIIKTFCFCGCHLTLSKDTLEAQTLQNLR
jgi:hypothetical protein